MVKHPYVSVLMPVYNGERYVSYAIESILSQTWIDFEFIIINDGSSDKTEDILLYYAAVDSRIRLISRSRRGLVATLNEGIHLAQGRVIARMDADDIACSNRFAIQIDHLESANADFCGGSVQCFGDWQAVWTYPRQHNGCGALMLFDSPFAHPTVIGRRSAFHSLRYSEDFIHAEDYDLWQRAWASKYRLVNSPEIVLNYRVHSKQVSVENQLQQRTTADIVRRRQWKFIFPEMSESEIEEIIIAISGRGAGTKDLLSIFCKLLNKFSGDEQDILFFNFYRIFCQYAGRDFSAVKNWIKLVSFYSSRKPLREAARTLVIFIIVLLRQKPDSAIFCKLKYVRASCRCIFRRFSERLLHL